MPRSAVFAAALAASPLVVPFALATELHCVGRLAHEVTFSSPSGGLADASLTVVPAPQRDEECQPWLTQKSAGTLRDADRHICVGANQDETCEKAKNDIIPLPHGARCQGCFVGVATDMYYSLNMTRLRLHHAGVGLRGTKFRSVLQIEDDEARASTVRRGSKTFGDKPIEWKLKIAGNFELDFKVSMPTEVFYELQGREGAHGDLGAQLAIDLGDNYVEYTEGKGWSHHKDEPKISVQPYHEGDYDALANLTLGVKSRLQAEVGKLMWFRVDVAPEVPLGVYSIGASGSDLIHSCVDAAMELDLGHEAAVDLSLFRHNFSRHWGPTVDRHSHLVHKCGDLHPRREPTLIV